MKDLKQTIENLISESKYTEATNLVAKELKINLFVMSKETKKHFTEDKEERDVYSLNLDVKGESYSFEFGQSIVNSDHWEIQDSKGRNINIMNNYFVTEDKVKGEIKKIQKLDKLKAVFIKGSAPTLYDVLTCLQKYEVGSFKDFCENFGYDEDSRTTEKIYKAVVKEFQAMERLFATDELEILSEIQ